MLRPALLLVVATILLFFACIEPRQIEYDLIDEYILISGEVSTTTGNTNIQVLNYVRPPEGERYIIDESVEALVELEAENVATYRLDPHPEIVGTYLMPTEFAGDINTRYRTTVQLKGQTYQSSWEKIPNAVPMENVEVRFNEQYRYDENRRAFDPGHQIFIDLRDPADQANFYEWRYTYYDRIPSCITCAAGIFRNGECRFTGGETYDYVCEQACWSINSSSVINSVTDDLFNGNALNDREVAFVEYENRRNILVEITQLAITNERFRFNRLLSDLTQGTGGLNAPPPAAAVGNIVNLTNPEEQVLGYFGAVAEQSERIFIRRQDIELTPTVLRSIRLEPDDLNRPLAPCIESPFRTKIRPVGWEE